MTKYLAREKRESLWSCAAAIQSAISFGAPNNVCLPPIPLSCYPFTQLRLLTDYLCPNCLQYDLCVSNLPNSPSSPCVVEISSAIFLAILLKSSRSLKCSMHSILSILFIEQQFCCLRSPLHLGGNCLTAMEED